MLGFLAFYQCFQIIHRTTCTLHQNYKFIKYSCFGKFIPIPCSVCAIDLGVDGAVVVTKAEDSETLTVVRILITHHSAHKFWDCLELLFVFWEKSGIVVPVLRFVFWKFNSGSPKRCCDKNLESLFGYSLCQKLKKHQNRFICLYVLVFMSICIFSCRYFASPVLL